MFVTKPVGNKPGSKMLGFAGHKQKAPTPVPPAAAPSKKLDPHAAEHLLKGFMADDNLNRHILLIFKPYARCPGDQDDLFAELWKKVLEKPEHFNHPSKRHRDNYLKQTARYTALERVRRKYHVGQIKTIPIASITKYNPDIGTAFDTATDGRNRQTHDPQWELERKERDAILAEALAKLTEINRHIVIEFSRGKTYPEIARELGMTEGSVRERAIQNRKKLGEHLSRDTRWADYAPPSFQHASSRKPRAR